MRTSAGPAHSEHPQAHRRPGSRARPWRSSRNSFIPAAAPHAEPQTLAGLPLAFAPEPDPGLQARFESLAHRWREETAVASAPSALFMHSAYQEIIGLGPAVLPLILHDLEETRSHWFWALRAITGENPVPKEERGRVDRMAERWLDWGRSKGLL